VPAYRQGVWPWALELFRIFDSLMLFVGLSTTLTVTRPTMSKEGLININEKHIYLIVLLILICEAEFGGAPDQKNMPFSEGLSTPPLWRAFPDR